MSRSGFNLVTFSNKVRSTARAVGFLQSVGILQQSVYCSKCNQELSVVKQKANTAYFYFHCEQCKTMKSVRDNTILGNKHIGMRTLCLLVYLFSMCQGLTLAQKLQEVLYQWLYRHKPVSKIVNRFLFYYFFFISEIEFWINNSYIWPNVFILSMKHFIVQDTMMTAFKFL